MQSSWPVGQVSVPQDVTQGGPLTSKDDHSAALLQEAKVNGVSLRRRLHWPKR